MWIRVMFKPGWQVPPSQKSKPCKSCCTNQMELVLERRALPPDPSRRFAQVQPEGTLVDHCYLAASLGHWVEAAGIIGWMQSLSVSSKMKNYKVSTEKYDYDTR
ncbi:unnamed protein product [Urochloa humidicola]